MFSISISGAQRSIEEEMKYLSHVGEFAKGNFGFIRLFLQYGRGVTQKGYLRQALGPQIVTVNEKTHLDLRTDPIAVRSFPSQPWSLS